MSTLASSENGQDLLSLSTGLPVVTAEAGEVLIAQGQPVKAIFVLVEGSLLIERDGDVFASTDTPGALFGEIGTVMGQAATATVRAGVASTLRIAADPHGFLVAPGVALAVLRLTATRLDTMTRYLTDVREQFSHMGNHLGMVDGVLGTLLHDQGPSVVPGSVRDPEG